MKNVTLTSKIGVDPELFDLDLLYHFIEHYKALGIEKFNVMLNATSECKIRDGAKIFEKYGIHPIIWAGEYNDDSESEKLKMLHDSTYTTWVLSVDSDEFVEIDNLSALIEELEENKTVAVQGTLIDRISSSNKLEKVGRTPSIWDQFPVRKALTFSILKAEPKKTFIFNKTLCEAATGGCHHIKFKKTGDFVVDNKFSNFYYHKIFDIAHFKWTLNLKQRLQARMNTFSKDYPWKYEWDNTIKYIEENLT